MRDCSCEFRTCGGATHCSHDQAMQNRICSPGCQDAGQMMHYMELIWRWWSCSHVMVCRGAMALWICVLGLMLVSAAAQQRPIPSTLDGPFPPRTVAFDASLRRGSPDLLPTDPRIVKTVVGDAPEQIALALSTPDALWISWITGDAQMGAQVAPLDPASIGSVVRFGVSPGVYTQESAGASLVYSQLYNFPGLLNYTSGIIHHVRLTGLLPHTTYYFKCGDPATNLFSEEHRFQTLSPASYPARIAIVGDLGLTSNSSTTLDHIVQNDPALLVVAGDMSYANQYLTTGESAPCYACAFPNSPTRESYQPHWDHWGRFMQPLTSRIPMMVIEGNHEIEGQAGGKTFAAYESRFAVPAQESGSNSSLYYSFDAGGIHFVMLGGYIDYDKTGAQYAWLAEDLASVNRTITPWLVAVWHPPWYNSYSSHYQEFECMRLQMEDLIFTYGVNIVFSGHVHAYERTNRVYKYNLHPCGPVYVTVGDGGNIEEVDVTHADDVGGCPGPLDNIPEFGAVCKSNYTFGPAAGQFCWAQQPDWSAFRESSFGHGILEVINSTHALWTWHRNQDMYASAVGDQIYIVRQPDTCFAKMRGRSLEVSDPFHVGVASR